MCRIWGTPEEFDGLQAESARLPAEAAALTSILKVASNAGP
jgi:hypothetical protein